jgi:hypothetical protein
MTEKNSKLKPKNKWITQFTNTVLEESLKQMHTYVYHYCLLKETRTQNLLQKFNISTYNLPGLTGLPPHHMNPLLTGYLVGFLTYAIRCTIPWTPYSYHFFQSAKSWLQPTLYLQIFFKCMLKPSATSQKALYTTACVLFSNTLFTYWPQCSAIQNTPTCSHCGTAILQTLASSLVWAHWVTTSKRVTIPSTQSYRFSGCRSGCSSNDVFLGFHTK